MNPNPRSSSAPFLLLAIVACSGPEVPDPVSTVPSESSVPRLLPPDYVAIDDERPFEWRQADYLRDALETEIAALTLEVEVENAPEQAPGPRKLRATQDRAALATLMMAARPKYPTGSEFAGELLPIDRFVHDFASETLRRESYTLSQVEAWRGANRRFLQSRDLADRDIALAARVKALENLSRAMPLRQILVDLSKATLDDATRAQSLGKLKLAYPDSPLPTGGFDSAVEKPRAGEPVAGSLPKPATPTASGTSNPSGLPRLDGAEVAVREIADMRALLPGASAGAPQQR